MDGADVCRTSSRASRRPPDVISTIAILNPRWRRRKWRHPGPGARFSTPIEEWGGKWRPLRFQSPSWVTSFVGTGNEVIQDGRRKRKGRHFPPHSSMGVEKRALYYSDARSQKMILEFNQLKYRKKGSVIIHLCVSLYWSCWKDCRYNSM